MRQPLLVPWAQYYPHHPWIPRAPLIPPANQPSCPSLRKKVLLERGKPSTRGLEAAKTGISGLEEATTSSGELESSEMPFRGSLEADTAASGLFVAEFPDGGLEGTESPAPELEGTETPADGQEGFLSVMHKLTESHKKTICAVLNHKPTSILYVCVNSQ